MDKNISLPQFAGESNPFDELWYLSIEIGRALLFKAKRINTGIPDSEKVLKEKYDKLYDKVSKLSEKEREFLLKDSYFSECDFYNDENKKILALEKESASMMSFSSQLVSKDFLIATLGEKEGTNEYNRRCKLARIGDRYTRDFLTRVISYLDEQVSADDGIKEFMKQFESKPSIEDIQLMLDVKNTSKFRFYTGGNN